MKYYDELPFGYKEIYHLDATNKKFVVLANIISALVIVLTVFIITVIKKINFSITFNIINSLYMLGFLILLVFYIIFHELIHGLFYKIFTHKKLTFGLKLSCAYCGIPNIYMKKWPMIITALAPFMLFNIVFIISIIFTNGFLCLLISLLFSIHLGGCSGDLFISFKILISGKNLLINDTGPKQTIYRKE